ncbi:tyrosine-type recombinase/integrase [Actinacidiphila glaucinigra]|uniref:tyrosine-type recombinase/integrase n=1 Tax=Actinacidiphila glaucinigra TaxID=235986 RepID=UPI0033F7D868
MTHENSSRRKAGNGEDSVYWDASKKRYVGAVSHGYTPSGKRRRPKVYGKTKTEVRRKLRDLKNELATGVKTPANYTVANAVEDWLTQGLKGRDARSIETYKSLARNHITPDLGKAKLRDLQADDLDDWLEAKAKMLSKQSLKMVRSILRRSISHAQRRGKALRNVAELVDLPEGLAGRPSKSLTMEQAERLLGTRPGTWIHAYVVLSLLVGVRTEECRALTWKHVHLADVHGAPDSKAHIDVWRSVRRHGDTKTDKSRRSLVMAHQAASVMTVHRGQQMQRYRERGLEWNEDALVFPKDDGEQRDSTNVLRNFRSLLKDAGFPDPKEWTTRELRTSFVSLLSDHGIPIEVISRVVGHSGSATTERVYRKQLRPLIAAGAEAMDDIFEPGNHSVDALREV